MKKKTLVRSGKLGIGLVLLGILTGCAGGYYAAGPDWYGPDYGYYGPGFVGGYWGPDGYVFGHHEHGVFGHDRDFGRRGSRAAAPGAHSMGVAFTAGAAMAAATAAAAIDDG